MLEGELIYVVVIAVLVMFSAYFSATETAFTSLNRIKIKNMSSENRRAKQVLKLSDDYDKLLSTILIGNNIVNIGMTALATVLFVKLYGDMGATISTVVMTLVVLVFGEISPKSMAKEAPERFSLFSAPLLKVFIVILTPLNFIFTQWKKLLNRIFKFEADKGLTDEELITLVEEAETDGYIDEDKSELIQNAIEFSDLEAFDILTPRVDIVAVSPETSKDEIKELFKNTGFSRVPVYKDSLDNVIGVLNQKDFHNYINGTDKEILEFVKPAAFAPGTMKISHLLKVMQEIKTHIAIIVDEYGGTEGLLTMEDIIEELVGEIYDEHDAVENQDIIQLPDGSYNILCSANLDKIFEYFDIESDLDVTTVNGWVLVQLGDMAKIGDTFEYQKDNVIFKVRVMRADEKKAIEINMFVEKIEEEDDED
ncbi:MAG: HlyC/CorC family transporter [Clostridiales bacterium]|nr:HlyC/CorC family transporter [Clostridiales bacterium]